MILVASLSLPDTSYGARVSVSLSEGIPIDGREESLFLGSYQRSRESGGAGDDEDGAGGGGDSYNSLYPVPAVLLSSLPY